MKLFLALFVLSMAGVTATVPSSFDFAKNAGKLDFVRRLEDTSTSSTSSYTYLDDLSAYRTQFGKCLRIKVQENNDDDGNAHFYNGNYHAQYYRYASFYLCSEEKNGQCGSCDYSTEYVTGLDTYLDSTSAYLTNLCGTCAEKCRRARLLQEDEEGEEEVAVDCSSCSTMCALYENGDANEFNYLDCQKAYVDADNGLQYYSAAACDSNGDLYIGLFYNNACTIKAKKSMDVDFTYNNFKTVQTMCTPCESSDGMCDNLYLNAEHCVDGTNMNANVNSGEMPVCKTYKEASTERTYKTVKKPWFEVPMVLIIFAFVFFAITMGSYTYYIRHREKKVPLAAQDGMEGKESQSEVPDRLSEAVIS